MKNKLFKTFVLILVTSILLFALPPEEASKKSIDWPQLLMTIGYLAGVFILLPIVIYTNMKEKLSKPESDAEPEPGLSEQERNQRSQEILNKIDESLTPFQTDDGEEMITITKGKQARLVRNGLNYINNKLMPTDEDIKARVKEFEKVYEERAERAFTGSKWIIICAIAVGILITMSGGSIRFLFIHALGIIFYILSSRTPMYRIEKRMEKFGGRGGTVGKIMSALFLGSGTKYYIKSGSGPWKRDWETEGQMAMIGFLFLVIIAAFLGMMSAFLGVINFVINYSTSFILPFKSNDNWYAEKIK
ncbi:MAG: hypothetical protein ACLFQM_06655 [Fidelibacterota bacterium]